LTAGFTEAKFAPVFAVEWDLCAAATYAANFGEDHMQWCDIADIEDDEIPKSDVVAGGPPCQGFSNLGTKDPDDPRNRLWREFVRFVLIADPQVFVLENVDRFSRSPDFDLLMDALHGGQLRRWSHVAWAVLNAADYGVPQRRCRTILVASRVGPVPLPSPTHAREPVGDALRWKTVRDAISGLPSKPATTVLPDSKAAFFDDRLVPGVFKGDDLHIGRRPRQMSLERYDCIPPGGGRFDLPDHLMPRCWATKPTGTTDVMGRMRWDAPSLTIRTEFFKPEKGQYLHPQWHPTNVRRRVNRPITHLEAALLQSFDEDYLWCGTKIEIAKQIGNAVPPGLAAAIAETVGERLA